MDLSIVVELADDDAFFFKFRKYVHFTSKWKLFIDCLLDISLSLIACDLKCLCHTNEFHGNDTVLVQKTPVPKAKSPPVTIGVANVPREGLLLVKVLRYRINPLDAYYDSDLYMRYRFDMSNILFLIGLLQEDIEAVAPRNHLILHESEVSHFVKQPDGQMAQERDAFGQFPCVIGVFMCEFKLQ
ncbi:unnamed protein product, partial [Darwinula stevensoni]